jgi:hypothetical protein
MPFGWAYVVLCLVQGAAVAAAGHTLALPWRSRRARALALIPPASIVAVVAGIDAVSGAATVLTDVALVLVPIGAALALALLVPGARPALAGLAAALLAVAWAAKGTTAGDATAVALTALSAVAAGAILAAVAPLSWLEIAIIVMSAIDVGLIVSDALQQPNALLNAAAPPGGAPQLQRLQLAGWSMGYGDVFVAGLLGAILRRRGWSPVPAGVLVALGALAFGFLFFVTDELPATVPVAAVVVLYRLRMLRTGDRGQ